MRLASTLLSLSMLVLAAACGDDDASRDGGVDAFVPSDGALRIDADLTPDAGTSDAPAADASADASGPSCGGICDPRGGRCSAGSLCVLVGEEPSCAIGSGTRGEGERCAVPTDCVAGTTCFRRREGGVCGRVCCAGDATCGDTLRCGGPGVLVDGATTSFGECLPERPCDVLGAASECLVGEACFLVGERGETDCRVPGSAQVGEACEVAEDCEAGATCTGLFERSCVRVCRLETEGACPAGEGSCVAYAQSPPGTGLCTVMASIR
ncbi:MAG: hypothetical protein KC586_05295 [Myxococcales bacterium]|nr:hypothetical protein [Myxococcales bacterium]